MAQDLYVIVGASGHVGAGIARSLLESGKKVRAVARKADALKQLADRGAEVSLGTVEDAAFLKQAFAGAHAAFLMIPPNFALQTGFRQWQNRIGENFAGALEATKVPYAVTLSSVGAHLSEGNGPVAGLYDLEQRLNAITALNVLHLRPTYFLENHLNSIGMIKGMGFNGGALRADLAFPQIATRDIAVVGARRLTALDFKGKVVHELLGARDVSMDEVTRVFGKAIGKPDLQYRQFPYADAQNGMVQMGLPAEIAGMYMEMTRGFNEGKITPTQPRNAETTTPTTVEEFATSVFAPAFNR
jgi:uncharacterized protein YbjT (DUF2867 family)